MAIDDDLNLRLAVHPHKSSHAPTLVLKSEVPSREIDSGDALGIRLKIDAQMASIVCSQGESGEGRLAPIDDSQ
jgi:hypothetical protein